MEPFDQSRALLLLDACRLLRGRTGKALHIGVALRYVREGATVGGVTVRLPAVKLSGAWWTMPGWVAWFQTERIRLGMPTKRNDVRPLTDRQKAAAHRRAVAAFASSG